MALDITALLPDPAHRTKRQAMVDDHFGSVHEGNFTGFTPAEEAGFTTVQATSATALVAALSALGPADKQIIECAWNGVSSDGGRVFGLNASVLSANAGVDWGYTRPACSVIIRPAAGFSPTFVSTYSDGVLELVGLSKIQIENMVFDATSLKFSATPTYPAYAMVALKNNSFTNNDISAGNKFTVTMSNVRTMHATGNQFRNCSAAFVGSPNYLRSWDNRFEAMSNNDVHGIRGYDGPAAKAGWTAHVWVAGNIVYNMSAANPASGLHCDFLQISSIYETGQHWGYKVLAEFNLAHLDRGGSMAGTQGFFGDDGSGYAGDWLVHNNLVLMSAYWACMPWDATDNQAKVVTKNMFLRAATANATQDAYPRIEGLRSVGVTGTGSLEVSRNYGALFTTGKAAGEQFSGNVVVSPRANAAAGTRYVDVITGNGSFSTDANGFLTYTSPDAGISDAVSAKAAIVNFAKPLAGWGATAGPEDPALWPSGDYANLGSGGSGGGTGGGGGSAPYTLPGPTVAINVQVV